MTTGKNTIRLQVKKVELKTYCIEKVELKTCLTPRVREDFLDKLTGKLTGKLEENTLASIKSCKLVQKGRNIYEEDSLKVGDLEERELEERRKKFKEEKIKLFEKTATPTRRRKPEGERKMTPKSMRKIERSSQKRKVYGEREKEKGKMLEGLRLGHASA